MGSSGVIVARALAASAGLNPDSDIRIVVAGEGAQTAALVRTGQVDALSQYDTQYALVENAGVKLRVLPSPQIERFPSNGFVALEETLRSKRKQSVALAQGYAKGTLFAIANPEAAIRILWEVYPQTKPTGKDEATALSDDVKVLRGAHPELEARERTASRSGARAQSATTPPTSSSCTNGASSRRRSLRAISSPTISSPRSTTSTSDEDHRRGEGLQAALSVRSSEAVNRGRT